MFKPDGDVVNYIKVETDNTSNMYYYTKYIDNDNEIKLSPNDIVSITGHSLGGHLAGLLSMFTGLSAELFNAPGYHNFSFDGVNFDLKYVSNGDENPLLSFITAFEELLKTSINGNNISHIINPEDDIANLFNDWGGTNKLYCINDGHKIDYIINTLYVYDTIKDVITEKGIFFNEISGTNSKTAYENVKKLYTLYKSYHTKNLNTSSVSAGIEQIKAWLAEMTDEGVTVKVDIYNDTSSGNKMIITDNGNQLIYLGGGHDGIITGSGNDIVYAENFTNIDTTGQIKSVDLGDGNNKYYGGNGTNYVTTGNGDDLIYAGKGNDIIHSGTGSDMIYAGAGNNVIYLGEDNDTDWVCSEGEDGEVDTIYEWEMGDHLRVKGGILSSFKFCRFV